MFVTGDCTLTATFVPGMQPLTATAGQDWTYQNTATSTANRHAVSLWIAVTDPNDNSGYNVTVTANPSSTGTVVIESTSDPLTWTLRGGQRGVDPVGPVTLDVVVTGVDKGGACAIVAQAEVRQLGDIDGSGAVNALDKAQLTKRLNGLAVTFDDHRFDLDGSGAVNALDKALLTKALNGLAVP